MLLPGDKRKYSDEIIIKKRLRDHAKKLSLRLVKEHQKKRKKGIILSALGMVLIGLAAVFSYHNRQGIWLSVLRVIFEPAGWFSAWFGLEILFRDRQEEKPDYDFYHKLTKAELKFESY